MIREVLSSCYVDVNELREFLKGVSKVLGGDVEVIEAEDGVYGRVSKDDELLYDVRVGRNVCELYVKIRDRSDLKLLNNAGFSDLGKAVSDSTPSYPSEVVISKVIPSRSIYILLSGRDLPKAFPSVRITFRRDFREASSSYCRVSSDEDTCKMLNALLRIAEKYWSEMFG